MNTHEIEYFIVKFMNEVSTTCTCLYMYSPSVADCHTWVVIDLQACQEREQDTRETIVKAFSHRLHQTP